MEPTVEWDSQKELANQRKHGVSFTEAETALEDEQALTVEDDHPGERRFISIGQGETGRMLVVVYTYRRAAAIRIISARKANASERRAYEDQSHARK